MAASYEYFEVEFQGERYLLITSDGRSGPLATPEQYENGECSFAHLFEDGDILRYGEVIGHREELRFTGESVTVAPKMEAFLNVLTHPSWRR